MASSKATSYMALLLAFSVALMIGASGAPLKYPCRRGFEGLPFCNASLAVEARVADLVGRLTLHEKALQLVNSAAGVARLGLPPYEWWSEALHGVSNQGPGTTFGGSIPAATSFPQVLLSAASFNATLWRTIGQVISTEARAMYNMGQSGLTYWSPNINIFRDPRWGRGQETPGEDPLVVSTYAVNFVKGLQSIDPTDPQKSLKVGACCKHYTAYDLDQWEGIDRFHFNAKVTAQDLGDTYQPPFQACVEQGDVACVMCSYNRVNGVPTCADKDLLSEVVRKQWGLDGYIASDCDSVRVMYKYMHYTQSPVQSVADSILAGLNLNCGYFLSNYTQKAVEEGLIREQDVDKSLAYLYTTLMRLGYFDGNPRKQKWGGVGPDEVCTDGHKELAVEAAKQGMVLLKNEGQALPLSKDLYNVAVIGPNADSTKMLISNYAGLPCRNTTALRGIERYVDVLYVEGCKGGVACNVTGVLASFEEQKAIWAAKKADAVVLVMGLDQTQERESFDRTTLLLPGRQQALIESAASAAGGPVVLVIMSGGPVDISFAHTSPAIHSIIWAGYPGEAGGDALASILFGDHNPSGRLPNTWYTQSYTQWPMTDMRMRPDPSTSYPGRTYRFHTSSSTKLYEFGHGLSYTNFSISLSTNATTPLELTTTTTSAHNNSSCLIVDSQTVCDVLHVDEIKECPTVDVTVEVHNEGQLDGAHTVLLMWHPPKLNNDILGAPISQLLAFQPLWVPSNSSNNISFPINVCQNLSLLAPDGVTRVLPLTSHSLSVVTSPFSSPSIPLVLTKS